MLHHCLMFTSAERPVQCLERLPNLGAQPPWTGGPLSLLNFPSLRYFTFIRKQRLSKTLETLKYKSQKTQLSHQEYRDSTLFYELNYAPLNSYAEALTPNLTASGDWVLGRQLRVNKDIRVGPWANRTGALQKEDALSVSQLTSLTCVCVHVLSLFPPHEDMGTGGHPQARKRAQQKLTVQSLLWTF